MLIGRYATKADLERSVGEPLHYVETHVLVPEYRPFGVFVVRGPDVPDDARPWMAEVTVVGGTIVRVE